MNIQQFIEQITQGEFKAFREYLNTAENGGPIKELNLRYRLLSMQNKDAFLEGLFEALKQITTLTTLRLSDNNIGNQEATTIAKEIKTNAALTTLELDWNNINQDAATTIADAIKSNTVLTTLGLSWNNIGPDDATAIAQLLSTNVALTILNLFSNNIGPDGATVIAESLKTNTTLTTLELGANDIGCDGATVIAESLKTNTTLTTLELGANDIGCDGAAAIAKTLISNTAITKLGLSRNKIDSIGARSIAESLKSNATLTTLNLSYNNLTQESITAILSRISLCSALTTVVFDDIDIDNAKNINNILDTLQTEKKVLDEVYDLLPQPITEAFAQYFTAIENEAAQNLLIDPDYDISRGLAYVKHRRLTEDNKKSIIEENKRREQAQSGKSVPKTARNAATAPKDSRDIPQTFATGKRKKKQDNAAKRHKRSPKN